MAIIKGKIIQKESIMEHNSKSLSTSAQSVQNVLIKKGLPLKVVELSASTRTAQDAAQTIDCEVAQIVKSLIFCTQNTFYQRICNYTLR